MLAESFITAIRYKEKNLKTGCINQRHRKNKNFVKNGDHWKNQIENDSNSVEHPAMKPKINGDNDQNKINTMGHKPEMEEHPYMVMSGELVADREHALLPTLTNKTMSVDMPVPFTYGNSDLSDDTYHSWSCRSICKNYPDLQIGGDNVTDISLSSSVFQMDLECSSSDGPVLQSIDLSLDQSPIPDIPIITTSVNNEDIKYKSITLPKLPLSNSMINNYMEKKMTELYKQYLEDTLTWCASPAKLLSSSFFMNNIKEISQQISQEHNMDTVRAREMAITCLLSVASGGSSEISTPNLLIS
ncbi:TLR adapter interacting with SLC15A4 on the lysosome-like [Protopterus annectens]|uniref:TLR adapter interacting with SLC15A4 on the lysosome-like n=1 Tax=Protopterus annectens TaxID=7888 RepID=UPI001CF9D5E6|nr:TLR adapter interacting with SLC15A4 on the lysosome-like [Protopterus annectens]